MAATIIDSSENDAGSTVEIVIDHIPVGTYQISRRVNNGRFHNVVAELSASDKDRLLNLIRGAYSEILLVKCSLFKSPPCITPIATGMEIAEGPSWVQSRTYQSSAMAVHQPP